MKFIFISPIHLEKWDYRNPLEVGIGGSETAHVEVAIRLAKRGHTVISYSPKPKDAPIHYKGIEWRNLKEADYSQDGIWVVGRAPFIANRFTTKHTNKKLWLVMQDVVYTRATKQQIQKFDLLLPLCPSHVNLTTSLYPYMKEKIVLSSNGIRSDIIKQIEKKGIKRNPYKLIFASSPDRGLLALLKIFKTARRMIPELELHVFYGFNNIDKMTDADVPIGSEQVTKRQILEEMDQPGVFYRGRIGQRQLYEEWLSSGVWCHPSAVFAETSCITSMDAQACGAIPITAPLWAIADNVRYGYFVDGYPLTDSIARQQYVDYLIDLLQKRDKDEVESMRKEMMSYARKRFDWERIVDQFEQLSAKS